MERASVGLREEAAFASRTRFAKTLFITGLTDQELRMVRTAQEVGVRLMTGLNIVIAVLSMTGLLSFVDVLFKQLNYFLLLTAYNERFPANAQAYNLFLQRHSSIMFPTYFEEQMVEQGLKPGEAVVVYFLATVAGSVLCSVLVRAACILLERTLFRRKVKFSACLKELAVVLEFFPFSILLSSNVRLDRTLQTRTLSELSILNFVVLWFCLIFVAFLY
jgi:hypothetical protein